MSSEIMRTILIMSISGGAVSLGLRITRPLMRHRLPKTAQYYFWIVALLAFLVPISMFNFMPRQVEEAVSGRVHVFSSAENNTVGIAVGPWNIGVPNESPATAYTPTYTRTAYTTVDSTVFILIYPWLALAVLMYNLLGYAVFAKQLRRTYTPAREEETALLAALATRKTPRMFRSKTAATPMLIGLFRPVIILPDREYTAAQLQSILLHELTHMRRFDIAVKWLSLLACAMHWFNPFVWLARREINRTCELACDEAVIRNMNNDNKSDYGNTLIDVATNTNIPMPVLSTTMCQEKQALKERLTSIMKNKKHTKLAIFISMLILLAAVLAACTLGATNSTTGQRNAEIIDDSPRTVQTYAAHYIDNLLHGQNVGVFPYGIDEDYFYVRPANILETRINLLEKEAEFHDILPHTIELWRLDFVAQTDDLEDGYLRWGTFSPDADGWIGQHTGWNDARTLLVFTQNGDGVALLGSIPWWMEETTYGLEGALRAFLEQEGLLDAIEPIPYVGAAHETGRIVNAMPLPRDDMTLHSFQIGADHGGFGYGVYTLTIHYNLNSDNLDYAPGAEFGQISSRLFDLIENLQAVTFSVVSYGETDTDNYIYRWSISRAASDDGGSAVGSFRGVQPQAELMEVMTSVDIHIDQLSPGEQIAIARVFIGTDVSYEVTVSSETGYRIFVGLQEQAAPGPMSYASSVSPENPRTTVIPFPNSHFPIQSGSYYLHIANHEPFDTMAGITVQIIPSGEQANIELLNFTTVAASGEAVSSLISYSREFEIPYIAEGTVALVGRISNSYVWTITTEGGPANHFIGLNESPYIETISNNTTPWRQSTSGGNIPSSGMFSSMFFESGYAYMYVGSMQGSLTNVTGRIQR